MNYPYQATPNAGYTVTASSDWMVEADRIRESQPLQPDSTPLLRELRGHGTEGGIMQNFNIKSIVLGMIVATACLALLMILYGALNGQEIPNDIKTFVFSIITLAIGGGGGATLWQAAEKRGEIKGEVNASNAMLARGLGLKVEK